MRCTAGNAPFNPNLSMKTFSQSKHFWAWFRANSEVLLKIPQMEEKEKNYWLHEIARHLRAYTRKLFFEIIYDPKGVSRFIITSYGNTKYFRMAEMLAKKAPVLPGWQIFGLQPPGLVGPLLVKIYGKAGIDLDNLWFIPPLTRGQDGKLILKVFAELYTEPTAEMEIAVEALVFDRMGEKTMGLEIGWIDVDNIFHLSAEEKKELVRMEEIANWIKCRTAPTFFINKQGVMVQRK
jgi:hypothetical protein